MELLFKLSSVQKPIITNNRIIYDPDMGGERRIYKVYEIKRSILNINYRKFLEQRVFLRPYNIFYGNIYKEREKKNLSGIWLESNKIYQSFTNESINIDWIKVNESLSKKLFKNQNNKFKITIN